ncbi:MAG: hypothetical protein CVU63_12795, partial [Deltaproteobacteria bacterium HGW-Deltaproteobacteria-20]
MLSDLGTILMWSAGARTLSGWSAEQAVGKPFSFWIADGDADMLRTWVDQLSHRDWIDLKTERAFADGTRRAVRSSLGALRDGSRLVGLLDIARDFPFDTDPRATALRDPRAHDALMHAQKLESLGVMAGGIAHDFNNLLTAMLGNSSLALRDLPMDNPSRRRVQDIHDAARRAAHLTRQLLAYSGKAKFEVRPLDLSAHVQEISHLMQACISKKSDLRLELTPDMPAVQADVAQLQQVVMNLVVNASEAIGEQGSGSIIVSTGVTTMTSDMCRRLIGGARLASGDYAFLRVSDTGCGIEPSVCEPICGDGLLVGDEECENGDPGDATCENTGNGSGTLTCSDQCRLDASQCIGFVSVSCGADHACAQLSSGRVACWGGNATGQ